MKGKKCTTSKNRSRENFKILEFISTKDKGREKTLREKNDEE